MFPKTFVDKVECLQSLVGVRTGCTVDKQYPFWIEDIEGVEVKKLAAMAKASNPTGKDFANQLINNGARQMMGDMEVLLNDGYKLKNIVGDMCSTCTLLPNYTANAGIIVKSTSATRFGIMRITKLNVLANATGEYQIMIDDGVTPRYYTVNVVAGTLMPIVLEYSTYEKSVRISFTDPLVPVGQIMCTTTNSCGCGGSANAIAPVKITGMIGGVENTTQYGFLPCVAIDCSYDNLVCNLIQQTPNIFGLTLLYKVGELYYANKEAGNRNNDAVSFNEGEKSEFKKNYGQLYWAKMKGTGSVNGLRHIVNDYLKTYRGDKCIICESKIQTAYVTG